MAASIVAKEALSLKNRTSPLGELIASFEDTGIGFIEVPGGSQGSLGSMLFIG